MILLLPVKVQAKAKLIQQHYHGLILLQQLAMQRSQLVLVQICAGFLVIAVDLTIQLIFTVQTQLQLVEVGLLLAMEAETAMPKLVAIIVLLKGLEQDLEVLTLVILQLVHKVKDKELLQPEMGVQLRVLELDPDLDK